MILIELFLERHLSKKLTRKRYVSIRQRLKRVLTPRSISGRSFGIFGEGHETRYRRGHADPPIVLFQRIQAKTMSLVTPLHTNNLFFPLASKQKDPPTKS